MENYLVKNELKAIQKNFAKRNSFDKEVVKSYRKKCYKKSTVRFMGHRDDMIKRQIALEHSLDMTVSLPTANVDRVDSFMKKLFINLTSDAMSVDSFREFLTDNKDPYYTSYADEIAEMLIVKIQSHMELPKALRNKMIALVNVVRIDPIVIKELQYIPIGSTPNKAGFEKQFLHDEHQLHTLNKKSFETISFIKLFTIIKDAVKPLWINVLLGIYEDDLENIFNLAKQLKK